MSRSTYESPFNARYASEEMQYLFSPDKKFRTWRRLWIALAESEMELGLGISQAQVDQLKAYQDDINYDVAEAFERETRHDVMSHVHAYGTQADLARPIIHLGATSCYVGDNTDILVFAEALQVIRRKVAGVLRRLSVFATEYRALPTLGFTHYQPAQLVTVGKRACLWMQELLLDLEELDFVVDHLRLLGNKGTTGTQASFLELFEGDHDKVVELERRIAQKLGYPLVMPVTGQTYSRKQDTRILNALSGIAQSAWKFSNDLRLLANLKEMEEPFEKKQIGSSAMAYKRNPMRSERMSSLSRYVVVDVLNAAITSGTQWFERTLDDSANRRISLPEGFLAVDAILNIWMNVAGGMVVYPKMIEKRVLEELPFMATENILMAAVKHGGDRQDLHERIRVHSMDAARTVKVEGKPNDLLDRIAADPAFGLDGDALRSVLDPALYVGRSPEQVDEFIQNHIKPALARYAADEPEVELKA